MRRLFRGTLEAATAAGPPVLVVSPDPAALALARDHGAAGLEEPRPIELNHALELAAREAAHRGAGALLVVSADPPGPGSGGPACYAAAVRAGPGSAGGSRGGGSAPGPGRQRGHRPKRLRPVRERRAGADRPRTRPGSGRTPSTSALRPCSRSSTGRRAARGTSSRRGRGGARIDRVDRPGLRFDLDTPDDLERYERRRLGRPRWGTRRPLAGTKKGRRRKCRPRQGIRPAPRESGGGPPAPAGRPAATERRRALRRGPGSGIRAPKKPSTSSIRPTSTACSAPPPGSATPVTRTWSPFHRRCSSPSPSSAGTSATTARSRRRRAGCGPRISRPTRCSRSPPPGNGRAAGRLSSPSATSPSSATARPATSSPVSATRPPSTTSSPCAGSSSRRHASSRT